MSATSFTDEERKTLPQEKDVAHVGEESVEESAPEAVLVSRYGSFGLGRLMAKLFASGVEARGVERVPEDQRDGEFAWNKYVVALCLIIITDIGRVQSFDVVVSSPYLLTDVDRS